MEKPLSFIEQLNNRLKQLNVQKIRQTDLYYTTNVQQSNAKDTLFQIDELNDSTDHVSKEEEQISSWNIKRKKFEPIIQIPFQTLHQTGNFRRRNFIQSNQVERKQQLLRKRVNSNCTERIHQLKHLLSQLQTPKRKKSQNRTNFHNPRMAMTSARKNKNILYEANLNQQQEPTPQRSERNSIDFSKKIRIVSSFDKHRSKKKNCENTNPVLCQQDSKKTIIPLSERKYSDFLKKNPQHKSQYQKINRLSQNWQYFQQQGGTQGLKGKCMNEKQILQCILSRQKGKSSREIGNPQDKKQENGKSLHFFSNNFLKQTQKKGTLKNLLLQ